MADNGGQGDLDFTPLFHEVQQPSGYLVVSVEEQMEAMAKKIHGLKVGERIVRVKEDGFINGEGI